MEDKDYRRLNAIEDELRVISQDCDKMRVLKRDIQGAETPIINVGGKTLSVGADYKITYKNNKKIGKATVTITGVGSYTGTVNKTFLINPRGTTLTKITSAKRGFTAK